LVYNISLGLNTGKKYETLKSAFEHRSAAQSLSIRSHIGPSISKMARSLPSSLGTEKRIKE